MAAQRRTRQPGKLATCLNYLHYLGQTKHISEYHQLYGKLENTTQSQRNWDKGGAAA